MNAHDVVAILHVAGFVTGIALYAMLAVMTLRRETLEGAEMTEESTRLPLAAAVLGLIWNGVALVVYGLRDFGMGQPSPFAVALAFAALGFLPAVVVHTTVRARPLGGLGRALVPAAYVLSAVGSALQASAAARNAAPSKAGLLTLTIGYGAILVVLFVLTARDRSGWRRSLFVVALAAFAVSALHLSGDAEGVDSWYAALLGHHASLPLVLVILYQDYRFAFVDLFLRRALALVALVALAVGLQVLVADPILATVHDPTRAKLIATSVYIALWVVTALSYPLLRRAVWRFVDRVMLERADYPKLRARVAIAIESAVTGEEILERVCTVLATALGARRVMWHVDESVAPAPHALVTVGRDHTLVRVPTADTPYYAITVGVLAGGRRLLSDDLALLEHVATIAARRIDAVRIAEERYTRDVREHEILQLAAEAELRALRAQLNPHFLFNALTTIGYLLKAAPERALDTLYSLTELLRAVLRRSASTFVSLGEEMEIVEAYLAIERARFEERLTVSIRVPSELRAARIPPLLLQPLVENAIKHGISPIKQGGNITVGARVEGAPERSLDGMGEMLCLWVSDTGVGIDVVRDSWRRAGGVGLANIEQRLEKQFGRAASMLVRGENRKGTTIEIRFPLANTGRTGGKADARTGGQADGEEAPSRRDARSPVRGVR